MMKRPVKSSVLTTLKVCLLAAIVLCFACKKEVVTPPNVEFIEPAFVASYSFGDTISVIATISHPNQIERVTLTLVDEMFRSVEPVLNLPASGNSFTINSNVLISNKRIETGKHYVRIQVRVGGESFNFFQEVNVFGLVRTSLGAYAVTTSQLDRVVYKLNNGSASVVYSGFGDANALAVNSFYGGVYAAPNKVGDLLLFSTESDSLIWTEPNTASSGSPFITFAGGNNEEVWGLYGDGGFKGYGNLGGIDFSVQLPINYRGVDAILFDGIYFVLAHQIGSTNRALLFYSEASKSFLRERVLPSNVELIGLIKSANNCVVCFNTANGDADWQAYTANGTQVSFPSLPNFQLTAVAAGPNDEIILGTDNGIYRYTPNPLNFFPISGIVPAVLAFDEIENHLWVGTKSSVSARSYPQMQLVQAYPLQDSLVDVAIHYNK